MVDSARWGRVRTVWGAMELTDAVTGLLREAAQALTGSERRRFLARTVTVVVRSMTTQ